MGLCGKNIVEIGGRVRIGPFLGSAGGNSGVWRDVELESWLRFASWRIA